MNIQLISTDCFSPFLELAIDRLPVVIGCDERADVRVTARGVSPRHCELLARDGRLIAQDMQSEHGTLVNGAPVTDIALAPGDTLTIGVRYFQVTFGAEELGRTMPRDDGEADCAAVQIKGKSPPKRKALRLAAVGVQSMKSKSN